MNEDWRLLKGQDEYLYGAILIFHAYKASNAANDHDHCEFCMEKFGFANENLHFGYSTVDNSIWICSQCYVDFKEQFDWKVISY